MPTLLLTLADVANDSVPPNTELVSLNTNPVIVAVNKGFTEPYVLLDAAVVTVNIAFVTVNVPVTYVKS